MTATIKYLPPASAFDPSDITITDDTSGAFLIEEGSNEYMRIDTTNGSELTQFKMPFTTGGFKYIQETSAGPYEFIKADATSVRLFPGPTGQFFNFNHMTVNTNGVQLSAGSEIRIAGSMSISGSGARAFITTSGHSWTELLATGATSKIQRLDGLKLLEVDTDSNATFTLDYGSGATFKVVDNNASPRTFISITEGSNTRCLIPTLSFNEVKTGGGTRLMQLTNSNGIAIENTPLNYIGLGSLTYDQSHDGTAIDIGKTPSFTVVYSSAASAAATSGITLQVTATDFQDGCVAPQYLVLQNQNATHSAKFILDPIGDFAAKETATTGTDAADLISSGFTLAAGKMAVFTLLACRVRDTGSHYFYCVSLHTKT